MLVQGYWLDAHGGELLPIVRTVNLGRIISRVMKEAGSDIVDYGNVRMFTGNDVGSRDDIECRVSDTAAYDDIHEALLSRNDPYSERSHWAACFVALRYEKDPNGRSSTRWIVAIGPTLEEMVPVE